MKVEKREFGKTNEGQNVYIYTITNSSGASLEVMNLGAGIRAINVPDNKGVLGDVVLGFDDPKFYQDPDYGYQGLTVGRWANRIRNASFEFEGNKYSTPMNQGTWTLHGGGRFSFSLWDIEETGDNYVVFSKFSPDMEDGFPGDFTAKVKYSFDDNNTVRIEHYAYSNVNTVANPTNHTYFNLSCDKSRTIEDQYMQIFASKFTETDDDQLTTGVLSDVKNTMMDFTYSHKIGDKIDEPFRAIIPGIGYDNNYCLDKEVGKFGLAATMIDEVSGRKMDTYTDLPGIQFYCGGWLSKDYPDGKENGTVSFRRGCALETQFYPDSLNVKEFPHWTVKANEEFKTVTEYRFSTI